jgi:type IV pilus assembly protein PilY1
MGSTAAATKNLWIDGFPVINKWDDPIQYTCQKNFILGIGDVNTHADKNLPGNTGTASEPSKPAEVAADTTVNSVDMTNKVGVMEGLGASLATVSPYGGCCNSNATLMAGLAYHANTSDIRPDLANPKNMPRGQNVKTYWVDVLEFQTYDMNNQFYLAAKYGGFRVPDSFNATTQTAALTEDWWRRNTDMVPSAADPKQKRPDNYFVASNPTAVVNGLTAAFNDIASDLQAFTTSFSTSLPQVAESGNASYSAKFDADNWTGEMIGSELSFNSSTGEPTLVEKWKVTDKLKTQFAGTGWTNEASVTNGRRIVTWNTKDKVAVPFRHADLSPTQQTALDTPYGSVSATVTNDSSQYLDYLRGDRSQEQTVSSSAKPYRQRTLLLGDIVGSKATPVGPPSLPLSDAANPGYTAFKAKWKDRPQIVYVGANDGMMHAINGSVKTGDAEAGTELFAYVPGALYQGPNATPAVDGLAALGNPKFAHHYYVNATPTVYDVDFGQTAGPANETPKKDATPDWRSVLIGGLGKGGRSYYAIDVTDPATMKTSEKTIAGRVLWEFTDTDMGYTFGDPSVIKTKKYGWVVILPSGYNTKTGQGYFYIVHPKTGALLEKISTGAGSTSVDAGMAQVDTFVPDRTDGTADAAYAGDLLGNVWRWDLTGTTGTYPAPEKIATLLDDKDKPQPITSRPMIEIQPGKNKRFVLVGTGRLLHTSDILSADVQTFYSILDGTGTRFNASTDLPSGVSFPLKRVNLVANTDLLKGIAGAPASSMGWYTDLGTQNNIAWRVINKASSFFGVVAFASILPNGDACEPTGISNVYGVDFGTGKTVLTAGAYERVSGLVTDLRFFSVAGKPRLIAGSDQGTLSSIPGNFGSGTGMRRLNWRELPVVD